ncbi:YwpF family protein [Niallia circulans]
MSEEGGVACSSCYLKKENDPAPFEVTILSIQNFGDKASILLEGTLKRDRKDYAELLLQYLIEEGYEGKKLSNKFTELMQSKPQTFLEKKL